MADYWSLRNRLENLRLKVHIDFPLRKETASRAFQPLIVVTVKVRPPSDSLVYFGQTMFILLKRVFLLCTSECFINIELKYSGIK